MLVIMVMMMMTILVMIMMMITTERSPLEDNGSRQMIANGLSVGATLDSVNGDDGDDCDNDDGDEGDEEHVNMAMALLQKLLDGVNIYLTFFNDNLAQDPGLQDTKNRYVLKKKSRQILLREVFKSNFENFLGRICLEIFFFSAYLFFGTLPTSQKKRL